MEKTKLTFWLTQRFLARAVFLNVDGCLLTVSSCGRERENVSSLVPLLLCTLTQPDRGLTLITSFNPNYLHKDPVSKHSHIGSWSFTIFRDTNIQSITMIVYPDCMSGIAMVYTCCPGVIINISSTLLSKLSQVGWEITPSLYCKDIEN